MNRGGRGRPGILINALRVENGDADADAFTYTVVIDAKPPRPKPSRPMRPTQTQTQTQTPAAAPRPAAQPAQKGSADRRDAPRQRTRLRSGKIIDGGQSFMTECLVQDLSATGMRLRLPADMKLPTTFQVYDDLSGRLTFAQVTWRRGDQVGIRFVPSADTPRAQTTAVDMQRKFYKMPR